MLAMEKNQQLNTHSLSAESLYGFLWEIKKYFSFIFIEFMFQNLYTCYEFELRKDYVCLI